MNNHTTHQRSGRSDEATVPHWSESQQHVIPILASKAASTALASHVDIKSALPARRCKPLPILPYTTTPVDLSKVFFPLSSDHLLTLLQYNVLRACLVNRELISRLEAYQLIVPSTTAITDGVSDDSACQGDSIISERREEWSSTSLSTLPSLDRKVLATLLPESLRPTDLQISTPHARWIDILPHPTLRENLIRITTTTGTSVPSSPSSPEEGQHETKGMFDPDALWLDSVGSLFDLPTRASSPAHPSSSPTSPPHQPENVTDYCGGIVWSPPWNASGWEFSPGFWKEYAWLFRGCEDEVREITNRYRRDRGEDEI